MSTDGRLTRALSTRDLAVYYLSSLVGVGVLVVPGIALSKAGPASLLGHPVGRVAADRGHLRPVLRPLSQRRRRELPGPAGVRLAARYGDRPVPAVPQPVDQSDPRAGGGRYLVALFGWEGEAPLLLGGFAVMSLGVLTNLLGIVLWVPSLRGTAYR
jgi:amino acid efflux transporter